MNVSIIGQCQVPPGFRFHPTEEELLLYYLRKKVVSENIDLDVIRDVDLNKLEPWEIQEKCKIGRSLQSDWYFFSHKDKKYPTGTRTNRATASGFWKATGRDKMVYSGSRRIGLRKTLVFYMGRAPHGQKSDWIMHEYRLDDYHNFNSNMMKGSDRLTAVAMTGGEDGWVVCRVFRKKNRLKAAVENPKTSHPASMDSDEQMLQSINDKVVDHLCLPRLQSPHFDDQPADDILQEAGFSSSINLGSNGCNDKHNCELISSVQDWIGLDRLVAWDLDDQVAVSGDHKQPSLFIRDQNSTLQEDEKRQSHVYTQTNVYNAEDNIWSFIKTSASSPSSSDPFCRFFV